MSRMKLVQDDNKRLAQFELLRILAMLGVLMNHVFNYGLHIYDDFAIDTTSAMGFLLWSLLEVMKLLALPSVNCYVLITGYFLADKTQLRLKGIWKVWSITWFYAVTIYLLAVSIGLTPFTWSEMLRHATPLCSNSYWFVTSYIALMLLAPLLSWGLQRLSLRQYQLALAVGAIVCFQPLMGWLVMDDQQILLFVYLFLIGGYIKRYGGATPHVQRKALWLSALTLLLMYAYTVYKNIHFGHDSFVVYAMAYHGLVLPLSVGIFLCFKDMQIRSNVLKKTINSFAPLCFSVYIIHTQSIVHERLWNASSYAFFHLVPTAAIPLLCILICVCVFLFCCGIDYCRSTILQFLASKVSKQS